MGASLNPLLAQQSAWMAEYPKREAFSRKANYLEPPFPWKIIPFNPLQFHLDRVPTPDDPQGSQSWPLVETLGGGVGPGHPG